MLTDPAERVSYLMWQTAHLFGKAMGDALEPYGITVAQYGALTYIAREPGVTAAELARRLLLTPQSVQTALKPLLSRGLIERRPHPVLGRFIGIFPTDAGVQLASTSSDTIQAVNDLMLQDLAPEEASRLHDQILRALLRLNPAALDRTSVRAM